MNKDLEKFMDGDIESLVKFSEVNELPKKYIINNYSVDVYKDGKLLYKDWDTSKTIEECYEAIGGDKMRIQMLTNKDYDSDLWGREYKVVKRETKIIDTSIEMKRYEELTWDKLK